MATGRERRIATEPGAFTEKMPRRLGAYARWVLGEETLPGLERLRRMGENALLGTGTLPYEAPNLLEAVNEATGLVPTPSELVTGRRAELAPAPMPSWEAEALGLNYTPVPAQEPEGLERFGPALARAQANDPEWVQRSREAQIENAAAVASELGIGPIAEAGLEMMIPIGPPGVRMAERASEFAQAAKAGTRAAESAKLIDRYADIERLRRHVSGEALLPDDQLRAIQSRVGRLEGQELAPLQPDPVAQRVPGLKPNDPAEAFEYVRMAPKYRSTDPRPVRTTVVEIGPEGNKRPVFFGQVSDDNLTEMAMRYLDEDEVLRSARWYEDARKFVDDLAPQDRRLGAQLLAGWQVSQRNESTDNAWRKLMNVVLEERLAEPVPHIKVGAVADELRDAKKALSALEGDRGPYAVRRRHEIKAQIADLEGRVFRERKSGALAHEDVKSILSGKEITDEEIGLKLFDFLDSAYGKATRSIAGNDPRAGAPAVVDVWMKRIQGVPDTPSLNKLIARARAEGDEAAVRQLEAIRKELPQELLSRGVPTEHEYEFMAEQLRRLAGKWTEARIAGKADWKPHEVQAVLWNASLRSHGDDMIFPTAVKARFGADEAIVGRASRTKDPSELRQAWVVASSWLSSGLDFDAATGWTATVRSRLSERIAENITQAIFGRAHSVPRKTSSEAARAGTSANLPTVTSATGRWRDKYEPSWMAYHPASTDDELEAFAAAAGVSGRQKAVYTFIEDAEGADALYLLRVPPKMRKQVSDLLLERGFEGQTVMDDGVALFDPGSANAAVIDEVARTLKLDAPEVVMGRFNTGMDFKTRGDAMAHYEQVLTRYAKAVNRPKLRGYIDAAREEGLSAAEVARGAYQQREARGRGALVGPRPGRGAAAVRSPLSQRALREKVEAGIERRRATLEGRRAADLPPAAGGGGAGGVGEQRIMQARAPRQPGRGGFGTGEAPETVLETPKEIVEHMQGLGLKLTREDISSMGIDPDTLEWRAPAGGAQKLREARAPEPPTESDRMINEAVEFFGVTDDPERAGYVLPDGRMLDFFDETSREGAEPSLRRYSHGSVDPEDDVDEWMSETRALLVDFNTSNAGARAVGPITLEQASALARAVRRQGKVIYLEGEAGELALEPSQATPKRIAEFFGIESKKGGAAERAAARGLRIMKARGALGVPKSAKQTVIPGVADVGRRPALPGTPGHTRPGEITADPTRSQPFAIGPPGLARGALSDFRPYGREERVTAIGGRGGTEAPESIRFEQALESELSHYSYRPEAVGVLTPTERGQAIQRVGLIARPTQAEIDILKGAMKGSADEWTGNPERIVIGDIALPTEHVARIARRLANRLGLTFPVVHPSSLRTYSGPSTTSVENILSGQMTAAGLEPGTHGVAGWRGIVKDERWKQDALGGFRPSNGLLALVRHGMSDEQARATMAHEFGHLLIGFRDKGMAAHYLLSKIGGGRWAHIYRELVENSRMYTRPTEWDSFFEGQGWSNDQIESALEHLDDAADRYDGSSISVPHPYFRYLGSGAELLADGVASVVSSPERAKGSMPKFVAALRRIVNDDPELAKRGIEMAGFGGALLMADEALRESKEKGKGGALAKGAL